MNFTIAICTYNQSAMLRQALESVNNSILEISNNNEVRLIVIDNNSTDDTQSICSDFAATSKLPFAYYFEGKQGLSNARNRALNETDGGVIIFTDDDVVVPSGWIKSYIDEYLLSGADLVYGPIYPEWGGVIPEWYDDSFRPCYALLDYGRARFVVDSANHEFFGANFSCKVDLLKEMGGFDPILGRNKDKLYIGEETEIYMKLLGQSKVIIYNPDIYVHHVIQNARKQKSYLKKYFRDIAVSAVYLSQKRSRRKLLGIPLYKYTGLSLFYVSLLPKYLFYLLTASPGKRFSLQLNCIKNTAMLRLYIRSHLSGM